MEIRVQEFKPFVFTAWNSDEGPVELLNLMEGILSKVPSVPIKKAARLFENSKKTNSLTSLVLVVDTLT